MDVRSLPIIGTGVSLLGVGLDLVLNSGELFVWVFAAILSDPGAILGVVSTLSKLAPRVGWLPEGLLEELATVLLIAVLLVSVAEFIKRRRNNA